VSVLGAGTLVFGVRPQLTAAAYSVWSAWSLKVDLLAAITRHAEWLKDSSPFTHVALSPDAQSDCGAYAIMGLIGLGAAVLGAIAFQRRNIGYS
jgi:putative exporter of polyketide antibiotics